MQSKKSKLSTLWLPLAICVLGVIAAIVFWLRFDGNRQNQITAVFAIALLVFVVLLLWFVAFSALSRKTRLTTFGVVIVIAIFLVSTLRVRSLSGDLLPVLEWRWSSPALSTDLRTAAPQPALSDLSTRNDYRQFLGPHRDGRLNGFRLDSDWHASPPKELWRQPVGAGWSAFAIRGALAITQEQRAELEMVIAYELTSGTAIWRHGDSTRYEMPLTGVGPHATPTIAGNRVLTLGATGILNCLEFASGEKIWSTQILADTQAEINSYGISNSPLVIDSLVVVSAGGAGGKSLVAYHIETGKMVWAADGMAHSAYSSPMLATLAGIEQIVIFNQSEISAHVPQTGKMLWRTPWSVVQAIAQPVILSDDRFFVSSGYGRGGKLYRVWKNQADALAIENLWRTPRLKAKLSNVVHKDGYLYGLDDGVFTCISAETGQRQWKRGRYGHGQIILVEDIILLQAEQGDIVLLEANPNEHNELARIPALTSKTWNHPALAAPYLLVRNDKEAVCFELPLENDSDFP